MASPELCTALEALSHSLDQRRLAHAATLEVAAPLFTPFAYVRKAEYSISRIIGDLLDPNGAHSQGSLFLRLFLDVFGFRSLAPVSAHASVTTESPTLDGRRIDIVIRDRTWIIGIENKPWAKDLALQVADYLKDIRSRGCPSAYLIFLTKDGRLPSANSIDQRECQRALARRELQLASYANILTWLDACCEGCRAERVGAFLSEFQDHLHEEVMNVRTRQIYNPVVDGLLAQDTQKYLPIALQIAQQKDAIRDALLERLTAALRDRLPHWGVTGTPMTADDGLALTPPNARDWHFCVELDSDAGKWCYGLKLFETHGLRSVFRLSNRLHDRFRGSEGPNEHWLMWLWFDNRTAHDPASYSQWDDNVQPWVDMADGTMAGNLAALATELHEAAVELSNS